MPIVDIERADYSIVKCDTDKHTLSYCRYHVKFTPLEWKIVKALYLNRPHFVKREDLIALAWNTDSGKEKYEQLKASGKKYPTRTIDVHISSIRKKLAYIKGARLDSIYGEGYRLLMLQRF